MELIREALSKAKASGSLGLPERLARGPEPLPPASLPSWNSPRLRLSPQLNGKHLEQQRIVAFGMNDPSHVAFNLLRTKILKALKDNGWNSLAVSSPTAGCGKTMVAINLALSLARQVDCKTVLIDLDLRKSAVARTLGVEAPSSIGHYLEGKAELEDCLVQVSDNLIVGVNNRPVKDSSEVMHDQRLGDMLQKIKDDLKPKVIVFDLPPMLSCDDAIAFLPRVDSSLLVIAAGKTTPAEVDECERQARAAGNFLGVALNKCHIGSNEYHHSAS